MTTSDLLQKALYFAASTSEQWGWLCPLVGHKWPVTGSFTTIDGGHHVLRQPHARMVVWGLTVNASRCVRCDKEFRK